MVKTIGSIKTQKIRVLRMLKFLGTGSKETIEWMFRLTKPDEIEVKKNSVVFKFKREF